MAAMEAGGVFGVSASITNTLSTTTPPPFTISTITTVAVAAIGGVCRYWGLNYITLDSSIVMRRQSYYYKQTSIFLFNKDVNL